VLVTLILVWLALSVAVAFIAALLGRGPILWFAIAVLLSPGVALGVVLIMWEAQGLAREQATPNTVSDATSDDILVRVEHLFDDGRLTEQQVERIRALARREMPLVKPKPKLGDSDAFTRPCPACGGLINPKAMTCMHCFAKVKA
jgi:hypothetical protein